MNNANNNINIQVRQSRREDVVDLIQMIEDLAAFEKIFNEPELSVEGEKLKHSLEPVLYFQASRCNSGVWIR